MPYKHGVIGSTPVAPTIFLNFWPSSSVWLERQPVTLEVEGSSPFWVATLTASVAQSVEQGTENPCVAGSIPAGGTIIIKQKHTGKPFVCREVCLFFIFLRK